MNIDLQKKEKEQHLLTKFFSKLTWIEIIIIILIALLTLNHDNTQELQYKATCQNGSVVDVKINQTYVCNKRVCWENNKPITCKNFDLNNEINNKIKWYI